MRVVDLAPPGRKVLAVPAVSRGIGGWHLHSLALSPFFSLSCPSLGGEKTNEQILAAIAELNLEEMSKIQNLTIPMFTKDEEKPHIIAQVGRKG